MGNVLSEFGSLISTIGSEAQFSTMPTADATNVGKIVQYVGATNQTYTNGYFYKCINNSGTYSWAQCDVQPLQLDELPTITEDNIDQWDYKVILYTGEDIEADPDAEDPAVALGIKSGKFYRYNSDFEFWECLDNIMLVDWIDSTTPSNCILLYWEDNVYFASDHLYTNYGDEKFAYTYEEPDDPSYFEEEGVSILCYYHSEHVSWYYYDGSDITEITEHVHQGLIPSNRVSGEYYYSYFNYSLLDGCFYIKTEDNDIYALNGLPVSNSNGNPLQDGDTLQWDGNNNEWTARPQSQATSLPVITDINDAEYGLFIWDGSVTEYRGHVLIPGQIYSAGAN